MREWSPMSGEAKMARDRLSDTKKKLTELNNFISTLDPAIRAAVFEILIPLYIKEAPGKPKTSAPTPGVRPSRGKAIDDDPDKFFGSYESEEPKGNLYLIAAWLYSQHGVYPIPTTDINKLADDHGLTIPQRPDMTMKSAREEGKNLFKKQGRGWKPTVHGEGYLKKKYGVKKGRKPVPPKKSE